MTGGGYIGIDVGGGGIRARAEAAGHPVESRWPGAVPRIGGRIDVGGLVHRIVSIVRRWDLPEDVRVTRVAVGLTGHPELVEPDELGAGLVDGLGAEAVIVANDSLTSHAGALEGGEGTIVAAGTGVVACATDHRTLWRRAGGWGHLVGDEGGGAWIGAAGIRAALREFDGRPGGSTALLARFEERFGDPRAAVERIYGAEAPAHEMAAFAPSTADAALRGDPVSRAIWASAGIQLAQVATAAARGVEPRFSWAGRLFDVGELLLEPFRSALLDATPGARLLPPAGESVDGALRLARTGLSDPTIYAGDAVECIPSHTG